MREILFRGKDVRTGYWKEGSLVREWLGVDIGYTIRDVPDRFNQIAFRSIVDPKTVGQFTGLTDKSGRKIFEGDILKIVHKYQSPFDDDTKEYTDITTDVVFFDDEGLCFSYGESPFLCVADNVTAEYEVVGNIHDNPELLEVTE